MRTFQFSDAKSHKFWSIEVSGSAFTVTYGKVGSAGQTSTKAFATPEQAQAEAEKLIREKTGKGYREATPSGPSSDIAALESSILAQPFDSTPYRIYADYLADHGDPRGEFMQVQIALQDETLAKAARDELKEREAVLLAAHERQWLGPLAAFTIAPDGKTEAPVGHRFERGWLERIEFHNLTVNQARALAAAPDARLLRELVVEQVESEALVGSQQQYIDSYYEPGPDVPAEIDAYGAPGLHALCRCPHLKGVHLFQLGEAIAPGEEYYNCHTSGELAYHLVKQMPNLVDLHLLAHRVDANKIFALPLPHLRTLQLYHSQSYPLEKLAANESFANLTALLCHPHALEDNEDEPGAYIRLAHLRAICRSKHLTALTHLQLRLSDFGDAGAKEIVESGILKRLHWLDLQAGCLSDVGANLLAACPDLKNLQHLNLRSNALTPVGVAALQATGVKVDVAGQHGQTGPFDGELPEYLFEGDIE